MHPALMKRHGGGMPSISIEIGPPEQPAYDPMTELMDGLHNKDLPKCLRALADYFAKESTEY